MTALVAAALLAQVQVRDSPKDWRLITTEHFNVYYPSDPLLPRAREFAGWFEEARADLARRLGVAPQRVNVFLYGSFHEMLQASFLARSEPLSSRVRRPQLDGRRPSDPGRPTLARDHPRLCRPNPHGRALALAEPLRDRILIHCQASDRWNAWFIRHELTHHVQYEHLYAWRLPGWLIALKDPLTPLWWWEGGADYFAGIFDSAKDQYVRDLAAERLYDLKELFFFDTLNPYDFLAPYYEGSYFWRFVDERYGAGRGVFEAYDTVAVPPHGPLYNATQTSREELEAGFAEHLRARWEPIMAGRGAPVERLTDTRAYYRRRAWGGRWSPDGSRLAWVGNADVWPELYVDGSGLLGWRRGLDTGFVVSPPSWSPDGKRLAVIEWATNKDVLVLAGVEGGLETIHLDFDELYDPAWSPDGGRIAFAGLKHGTSDLYVLHLADRRVERLTEDPHADSAPAWSRDGRLAWIKETEGRTVLHVLGREAVTKSWALMEYPQWSPDGKSIVVAADVGGVYDAFAVDPATGAAKRLTKLRGGVSYPSCHPDGSLVITYYAGRGQDLYRVHPEPQDEPGFDQEERKGWYDQFKKPAPRGEPAEKSRVWGLDWAMLPVTHLSWALPGFELQFGDRDAENTLLATGIYIPGLWTVAGRVANTRWRPTIGVTALASREEDIDRWRVEPFIDVPLFPTIGVGTGWVFRGAREDIEDAPDPDLFDSGPTATLLFSNQQSYQLRDPAWGFAFGGTASFYREGFGGDRDLNDYYAFLEISRDVAQDWIVWARVTYEKLVGREFLPSELLEIENGVRGAEDYEGVERGVVTLEVRFPLWRDLLWKPTEFLGMGEFLILKDLRGFVFGQAGYVGARFDDAFDDDFGAASAGLGLRLDLSVMAWPLLNARVPLRLEGWAAIVGQDERDPHGAVGFAVQLGF